jgi:predicted ATPase/DNA-binding XRE family transcriptional regulator
MEGATPESFGAHLRRLRQDAGFTQEELAAIAGLSVHAISALERGERQRPRVETVRALSAALDLVAEARDTLLRLARSPMATAADELSQSSLAVPPTALVGREKDLQALREWVAGPGRLITLVGAGGVGKTRLALELARGIAEEGSCRVAFVPLEYVRDEGLVACAIAEALGLADVSGVDLPRRARAACEGCPTLLVVDNFEQVPAAAPLLADLLASAPAFRLLVTSRAPLRVRGEQQYLLGPLALADGAEAMMPADLAKVAAVRLFVERVRDVQPDFRLTASIGPVVAAICRRLDGLPLALELAAPWMKVLTPTDLLSRLGRSPLPSTVAARDLPERQQTTNATVAWSYQLLDASTQRAFRRLGALPGRFSIEAAAAVLAADRQQAVKDDVLVLLATLIDRSLLLRTDSAIPARPLYRMLETVRTFAAAELAASNDDVQEGLANYCVHQAGLAFAGLVGPSQSEWLQRVHEELENYRASLTWLIGQGRAAAAAEIAWGLMFFWLIRGHVAEGLEWFEATLKLRSLPAASESRALTGMALMRFSQGNVEAARTAVRRAWEISHPAGDDTSFTGAAAADIAARVEQSLGHRTEALEWFARAIERYDATGASWGTGNALIGMSAVAMEMEDDEHAARCLDKAALRLQHSGPWFLARELFVRAILAVRRSAGDEAIALVRQSLIHIRDVQDKYAFVHAVVPLAAAAALRDDHLWAARILGARDVVVERTGARIVIKPVHEMSTHVERVARERLGPDRWTAAYTAGRQASIDSLLKDIDIALSDSGRA